MIDDSVANAVLNREGLLKQVGGDRELLAEVLAMFPEDCDRLLAILREAVRNGDRDGVARVAHSFKGILGSLSAGPAAAAAVFLEEIAQRGEFDAVVEACATLEGRLLELRVAIRQLQEEAGTSKPAAGVREAADY